MFLPEAATQWQPLLFRELFFFWKRNLAPPPTIVLLRATNPPSRATKPQAPQNALRGQTIPPAKLHYQPAQSGFSALRRLSAGKVLVFNLRRAPRRSAYAVAIYRLALRAFGYSCLKNIKPKPLNLSLSFFEFCQLR